MSHLRRDLFSVAAGLVLVAALVYAGSVQPRSTIDPLAWLLFMALFLFTDTFSLPIGGAYVSLAATAALGAVLVIGPWAAASIALAGSLVNVALRGALSGRMGMPRETEGWLSLAAIGLFNAVLLILSLLSGAALYHAAGGPIPLPNLSLTYLGPYALLVVGFAAVNYSLAGAYIRLFDGPAALRVYRQVLPNVVVYEMVPQIFTPLLPLMYTQLGPGPFLLFALGLAGAALITRRLAVTGERLEQRLSELSMLGALGQALTASLQIDDLLATLGEQLPKIMPVGGLYVALWQPETEEVSFPLALEKGQTLHWDKRRSVNGISEYVMRTQQPLLLPDAVTARAKRLGVTPPITPAAGWLAVPIIAGNQVLGALGVYALDPQAPPLSEADRDLLLTIATQLAMALNNARVYGQTDEALAQRVRQLSSILFTTAEGIMLLDADTRVLTTNRALGAFVGLAGPELAGRRVSEDEELLARLGSTRPKLKADLVELQNGAELVKTVFATAGPAQREVERTLAMVRGGAGEVAGWLMILRDVTEERALGRLRDDLTHMLIHDLRGPLSSMLTSLNLVEQMAVPGQVVEPEAAEVLNLAHGSGQHLLQMINELLDIARIESGTVPLERETISPDELLSGAVERLRPAAEAASIQLTVEAAPDLPELSVDVHLIGRVLDNLGDNAVKFSPNGSAVRLWTRAAADPGAVLFGISDEGPGLPAEAQVHLFENFNRLPNVRGRRPGSGLGLAFCRMVVEAHGGQITVESENGRGSTFVVRLLVGQ